MKSELSDKSDNKKKHLTMEAKVVEVNEHWKVDCQTFKVHLRKIEPTLIVFLSKVYKNADVYCLFMSRAEVGKSGLIPIKMAFTFKNDIEALLARDFAVKYINQGWGKLFGFDF